MVWTDPFFSTTLGIFGWFLWPLFLGSKDLRSRLVPGMGCSVFAAVKTFVLPFPFVDQPRLEYPRT